MQVLLPLTAALKSCSGRSVVALGRGLAIFIHIGRQRNTLQKGLSPSTPVPKCCSCLTMGQKAANFLSYRFFQDGSGSQANLLLPLSTGACQVISREGKNDCSTLHSSNPCLASIPGGHVQTV